MIASVSFSSVRTSFEDLKVFVVAEVTKNPILAIFLAIFPLLGVIGCVYAIKKLRSNPNTLIDSKVSDAALSKLQDKKPIVWKDPNTWPTAYRVAGVVVGLGVISAATYYLNPFGVFSSAQATTTAKVVNDNVKVATDSAEKVIKTVSGILDGASQDISGTLPSVISDTVSGTISTTLSETLSGTIPNIVNEVVALPVIGTQPLDPITTDSTKNIIETVSGIFDWTSKDISGTVPSSISNAISGTIPTSLSEISGTIPNIVNEVVALPVTGAQPPTEFLPTVIPTFVGRTGTVFDNILSSTESHSAPLVSSLSEKLSPYLELAKTKYFAFRDWIGPEGSKPHPDTRVALVVAFPLLVLAIIGKVVWKYKAQKDPVQEAETKRIADENARLIAAKKLIDDQKKADDQKVIDDQKKVDDQKVIDDQKKVDEEKLIDDQKKADDQKVIDDQKKVDKQRVKDAQRKADEQKAIDDQPKEKPELKTLTAENEEHDWDQRNIEKGLEKLTKSKSKSSESTSAEDDPSTEGVEDDVQKVPLAGGSTHGGNGGAGLWGSA